MRFLQGAVDKGYNYRSILLHIDYYTCRALVSGHMRLLQLKVYFWYNYKALIEHIDITIH
jgi:hypothetical protein